MIRKVACFVALIILVPASSYCFDLYVHSVKAPLYETPSIGSAKIWELQKGQRITGITEKVGWYQVKFKDKKGWVHKLMARKTPPLDKKDVYGKQVAELGDKARRRPSEFTTTAAARGLKAKRKRFGEKYRLDYDALEKVESVVISDEEASKFLMRGVSNE